ncbi:hypothetical protein [Winogradskyella sp. A2]|uniref:hypothetical protein n=1 Tax=Winogradskyella sp. A2 TaxID=3366944 RepID=UPI00398C7F27
MKNLSTLILVLFTVLSYSQSEANNEIIVNNTQPDDSYYAGGTIIVNATIKGDLIMAGGKLIVNDSIYGDLTSAGGELSLEGKVIDDVRVAGGKITVDSEIGDDLVVFGGEVIVTENAKIHGNLKSSAGTLQMNGEVMGNLEASGGDVTINGIVRGTSKLLADDIILGNEAKFHGNVEYWESDGEINFNNALVNAEAKYNEDLADEQAQMSIITYGTKSLKSWIFYVLSALFGILVFHTLFKHAFSNAVEGLENNLLKSFGFGLIYLIGIPFLILVTFLILIGLKLGLFAAAVFVFSLLFGHTIASILVAYYLRGKYNKNWGFWQVTFVALALTIVLRLLTMIPYLGILISVVVLAVAYGALTLQIFRAKKERLSSEVV